MTQLKNRFNNIITLIRTLEKTADRPEQSVSLLAVSKTWPAEKLRMLAGYGQTAFGENYLQEALEKITALADLSLEWHFIGPIQSNKTRDIASQFNWVHSVDRLKIARRLSEQRPENLPPLNVCIQINIDDEASKSGVHASQLLALAQHIQQLPRLQLRGLMIIPARHDTETEQRKTFQRAFEFYHTLQQHFDTIDTLSMGMSDDMDAAIKEGSTMVRIGTALFGQRSESP